MESSQLISLELENNLPDHNGLYAGAEDDEEDDACEGLGDDELGVADNGDSDSLLKKFTGELVSADLLT